MLGSKVFVDMGASVKIYNIEEGIVKKLYEITVPEIFLQHTQLEYLSGNY